MTTDDFVYAFVLLLSLLFGPVAKKALHFKPWICAAVGFGMFFAIAGQAVWHSLVTVGGFIFCLGTIPHKFLPYAAIVWCFGYLGFFRSCHYFGYSPAPPYANAMQLILTLRLIGLSFELCESWTIKEKKEATPVNNPASFDLELLDKFKSVKVSPASVIFYSYCYIGMFTGPYYTYRTFHDFCNPPTGSPMDSKESLISRLQEAPAFGVAYLILSHFYTTDYVRTLEFYDRPLSYRIFYMVIMFITFRMRIYFAWKMSECVCMAAELGAYPSVSEPKSGEGPTNLKALDNWVKLWDKSKSTPKLTKSKHPVKETQQLASSDPNGILINTETESDSSWETYDYGTIRNISVWGSEFAPTVRESMKSWNCTVQYWLASNFYRRIKASRNIRALVTMLISAYWHGIHPGYYLSFLIVPLALCAESNLEDLTNLCSNYLPAGSSAFILWLLKMRVFEYCAMGFLLLDAETTLNYWRSIGYFIHFLLVGIIVLRFILSLMLPARSFVRIRRPIPS